MSPQTIRHIAVAVVASLGIVLLYLWPTSAKSPTGGPQEAPISTSTPSSAPTTSAASSPPHSSPSSSDSGAASPYNPHERVDTHSPQTNGSSSGEPDRSASSPATTPTPDRSSTPPPPPKSSTSAPPSNSTRTPTTSPTSPTTEPSSPETSDEPPAPCTPPSGGPGSPAPSGSTTPNPDAPDAPGAPEEASRTDTTITVGWAASEDEVSSYRVYLNDELACEVESPSATLAWTAPAEGTDRITVTALDSAGIESQRSEPLEVGAQDEEGHTPQDDQSDNKTPAGPKSPSKEETP